MKRILALILAFAMVFCVCACKKTKDGSKGDVSSDAEDVIVEEVVIDKTSKPSDTTTSNSTASGGKDSVTSQTVSGSDVGSQKQPSDQPTSQTPADDKTTTSTNPTTNEIDYNTVQEIDICDEILRAYLDADDVYNQYYWLKNFSGTAYDFQNVSLSWKMAGGPYTVYFSEKSDFSNAITVQTNTTTVKNSYLVPGKTYYWKAIGAFSDEVLGGGKIKIVDAPVRFVTIDGIHNVRDMGGWKTESGKTVKYEMLYRGPNIDNITDAGVATIKKLGIKTEIDIRREDQKNQKEGTNMNWVFLETGAQYDRIFDYSYKTEVQRNYKEIFKLLSDEKNYPFYTHCQHGADRTGTFAFIVNGVLGVSYEDLTRDFEVSSFIPGGKRWRGEGKGDTFSASDTIMQNNSSNYVAWGELYKDMMEYGKKNGCETLEKSIEHWLINYVGVPKAQIDSFRNIMLK